MEYALLLLTLVAAMALARAGGGVHAKKIIPLIFIAFVARILVHLVVLRGGMLHYGGDQHTYEGNALQIASIWRVDGIHFVTANELPNMRSVAVPCNLFAVFIYLCDGPAPLACTGAIAVVAVGLALIVYHFAQLIGASADASFRLFVLTLFGPSFVLHTSDMFKDGINAILVVGSLYLAVGIAKRFSLLRLMLVVPCLWLLWYVRPYMVFMTALPLGLAIIGLRRALSIQGALLLSVALIGGLVYFESGEADEALANAQEQFDTATSSTVRDANAEGGSGVTFDDGGKVWGALGPKLAYTVLSPFPWAAGSAAFQLGKLETFIWYWLLWTALRGLKWLWRNERETLLLLSMFIVPATLAYATSMSNVGLIFRQRMPIVIVTSLLSAVVWTHQPRRTAPAEAAQQPARRRALVA